jgi:hypothetical protein
MMPMMAGLSIYDLNEMPVFEPNEYFWQHHWDGKEEKWRAYAKAMQLIMCEASGYKFSSSRIEDKFEYKKIVKGGIRCE